MGADNQAAAAYEHELRIGREIQQGFLPERMPALADWEIEVLFRPARLVAGDFYDGFELANGRRVGLLVADVCDKGVGAAMFMALMRTLLRHSAVHSGAGTLGTADLRTIVQAGGPAPAEPAGSTADGALPVGGAAPLLRAVRGTNDYMTTTHLRQGYFATLFFAVLEPETGGLSYINGGHNPPVVRRRGGGLDRLAPTGPAVGINPHSEFAVRNAVLAPGDTLIAFTDGVTEARNTRGDFFSERRLLALLSEPASTAGALLDRVDSAVRAFAGDTEQSDDITMLVLRHGRSC